MTEDSKDSTQPPDGVWECAPALIRRFLRVTPAFVRLASEVAYQLESVLRNAEIEVAAVTYRAKTLDSFIEKLDRKTYDDPLNEITDLAGVRVVHLYLSDFARIESIINEEFCVLEKVDKLAEHGEDRFGYGARHFLVRLGDKFAGARYDDLKSLTCEIQVRTALQDAWAIISHHLIYKRESDVPSALKRRINSLAGLFETADDQFEHIRNDRSEYLAALEAASSDDFLKQEINADSVKLYLERRFSDRQLQYRDGALDLALSDLDREAYKTIEDIDSMLTRTQEACRQYYADPECGDATQSAVGVLGVSLALDNANHRKFGWPRKAIELFEKYDHLVKKDA